MGAVSSGNAEAGFDLPGPSLAEVGEAELLRRLAELTTATAAPGVRLGSGDDAAVWAPPAGTEVVVSQDALVEGEDFERGWISPSRLGHRALAVALSDLAGMGATPAWCTATLCAPGTTQLADALEIHRGLCAEAATTGCALVGGDVSAINGPIVLDVCVGGTVPAGRYLRRDAGRAGDLLAVTGTLGRAAAGLRILQGAVTAPGVTRAEWAAAFLYPQARLAEGQALAAAGVRCGGDVSDGLLVEAERTAGMSRCGAELWLDSVPVDAELRAAFGDAWPELAVAAGEDFELLVAVAPQALDAIRGALAGMSPLSVVGRLVDGAGVRLLNREGGAPLAPPRITSRHFR